MKIFEWNQELNTSMEEINEQHQTLVKLFNELSEAIYHNGNDKESVLRHSHEQLTAYINYHFLNESNLMQQGRVDARHVKLHQQQHAQFSRQFSSIWASLGSTSNPANTLLEFLTSWLAIHILGVDQLMSRQIELIRSGETPEDAYDLVTGSESGDIRAKVVLNSAHALYRVLSHLNLELEEANTDLENRVRQRTRELEEVNKELTRVNQKLAMLSNIDGLLHIANRRYFDDRLTEECTRAFRGKKQLALLMIDVDFFKLYNETTRIFSEPL